MRNKFLNEALVGNSSMLASLDRYGRFLRIFWPYLDSRQLLDQYRLGLKFDDGKNTKDIFCEENIIRQEYISETNVLRTVLVIRGYDVGIEVTDFIDPHKDTITRMIKMNNKSDKKISAQLVSYVSMQGYGNDIACSMFDFETDSAFFYTKDHFMASGFDIGADDFFIGIKPEAQYLSSELKGLDDIGMMPGVVFKKDLGNLFPGDEISLTQYFCFAHDQKMLKKSVSDYLRTDKDKLLISATEYWRSYFEKLKKPVTVDDEIKRIYERSVLLFALMTDKKTGAILAAPEVDEGFEKSGRYAYCWGRDAVFITAAYDKCGLYEFTDLFFKWARSTQETDGSWHQRYCMNGTLAPCWGSQIDETAGILYGLYEHWLAKKDDKVIIEHIDMIRKAAGHLCRNRNYDTGLHEICYDLWEERRGIHAYSCAAIVSGLNAAVIMGRVAGLGEDEIKTWEERGREVSEGIYKYFWKPEYKRFIRSIYLKYNPGGLEDTHERIWTVINKKGTKKDLTPEDWKFDISLLGLAYPFDFIDPLSDEMKDTYGFIKKTLMDEKSGSFRRYENDAYIGGNPWVLATLWAGLYLFEAGREKEADLCLKNAIKGASFLSFLPEQTDVHTNTPLWVLPLTWSHAMFILLIDKIYGFEKEGQ